MQTRLCLTSIFLLASFAACGGGGASFQEPPPPPPLPATTTWIVTGTLRPPESGGGEEGDPPKFGPSACGPIGLEDLTMTFTQIALAAEDEPRFDGFLVQCAALDTQGLASDEPSTMYAIIDTQPVQANFNLLFGGIYYDSARDQTVSVGLHVVPGFTARIDADTFTVDVEFDVYAGDQRVLVDDGDGISTEVPDDLFPDCSGIMRLDGVRAGSGASLVDDETVPIVLTGVSNEASVIAAWLPGGDLLLEVEYSDGSRATAVAGVAVDGSLAARRGSELYVRGEIREGCIEVVLASPDSGNPAGTRVLLAEPD